MNTVKRINGPQKRHFRIGNLEYGALFYFNSTLPEDVYMLVKPFDMSLGSLSEVIYVRLRDGSLYSSDYGKTVYPVESGARFELIVR